MENSLTRAIEKVLSSGNGKKLTRPGGIRLDLEDFTRNYSPPGGEGIIYTLDGAFVIKIMKIDGDGKIRFYLDNQTRVYPGGDVKKLPIHRHSYLEMTYVAEGALTQTIGEREERLSRGDFSMVDHNSLHWESDWERGTTVLWLCFSDAFFTGQVLSGEGGETDLDRFIGSALLEQKNRREYVTFRPYGDGGDTEDLLLRMLQEYQAKDVGHDTMIKILARRLFRTICRRYDYIVMKEGDPAPHGNFFFLLDQFMRGNLQRISLSLLENRFGHGRNFYNRVIREVRGMTYTEYLRKIRLEESRDLLLNSDLSVSRIVEKVGYGNRRHFYEIFKDEFGQTPGDYRRLYKI